MSKCEINLFNESPYSLPFDAKALTQTLTQIHLDFSKSISSLNIVFMNNAPHTELNKAYLNHHFDTDVITFNLGDGSQIDGEIYINVDVAASNAKFYKTTSSKELKRLVIHGILHLVGLDDKTDQEKADMHEKENHYLSSFM